MKRYDGNIEDLRFVYSSLLDWDVGYDFEDGPLDVWYKDGKYYRIYFEYLQDEAEEDIEYGLYIGDEPTKTTQDLLASLSTKVATQAEEIDELKRIVEGLRNDLIDVAYKLQDATESHKSEMLDILETIDMHTDDIILLDERTESLRKPLAGFNLPD